jgi:hypothetical protein
MWRSIEVKTHEDNSLAGPILVRGLRKLDPRAGDVKYKILAFVDEVNAIASLISDSNRQLFSSTQCFSIAISASASACGMSMSAIGESFFNHLGSANLSL